MSIILFFIVLGVLVLSHEWGHFIVAKKSGIRVDEFGFGFPPKLFGWKRGETTYSLNILPFGGFVRIHGENPDEESLTGADAARSMANKPKWIQALVLVAGVTCNLLLAWFFLSLGLMSGLPVSTSSGLAGIEDARLLITSISPNSPASTADLKPGDEILSIADNKTKIDKCSECTDQLTAEDVQSLVAQNANGEVSLTYLRGGAVFTSKLKPAKGVVADRVAIGIGMDTVGIAKLNFFAALWTGLKLTAHLTWSTITGIVHMIGSVFQGRGSQVLASVAGPVGLVGLVSDAAGLGLVYLLSFTAFISINLAVLNLIPFPALDGGRLLFLLIEKVKGSPISPRLANKLNIIGFALLLLMMAIVTYSDISHLL
jgi:regulator of sigma E protease